MNRKPVLYTLIGLFTGSALTALVLLLTIKPFPQPSQAQSVPSQPTLSPGATAVPGMWGMMRQPDQHFIVMMIPHHEGAIAMADLALERSQRPEIRALAASIKTTQSREIEQMQAWYQQWYNADVPQWTPGMGMRGWNGNESQWDNNGSSSQQGNWTPGIGMHRNWRGGGQWTAQSGWQPGMGCMSMDTMQGNTTALQNASDFDRAFIEEMVPHHQMGVMMAQMVLANSDRPEIRELAQTMIDAQTDEINQMQQWHQDWYQ
jgi:uncharacterized protein (DUF305 family)